MHKLILKYFDLVKNLFHFIKIFTIFCILMLMFFWIENILNTSWAWLNFIRPILSFFVDAGNEISKGSINIFGAIFEYKYFVATIILVLINFTMNLCIKLVDFTTEIYENSRNTIKKMEEKALNKSLEQDNIREQAAIKNYQIYVSTSIKKKFSYQGSGVDLEEQNKIMNKFLMEKTGVVPEKFGDGFLYLFNNFNNIDSVLDIFSKLIKSEAPLDYVICVQIIDKDFAKCHAQLKTLAEIKFVNKISTFSDTIWRYTYNITKKYKTSQLGIFQKEGNTYEVHEFEIINDKGV